MITDQYGQAKIKTVSAIYTSNHHYCEVDRWLDPHGYSARVDKTDKDLIIDKNMAYVEQRQSDNSVQNRPATFDDVFSIFMQDHNIIYSPISHYLKGTQFKDSKNIDTQLVDHFDKLLAPLGDDEVLTKELYDTLKELVQDECEKERDRLCEQELYLPTAESKTVTNNNATQTVQSTTPTDQQSPTTKNDKQDPPVQ